jgi:hypothetical protein
MKLELLSSSMLLSAALLAIAAPARAQSEAGYETRSAAGAEASYTVNFSDDPLDALPSSAYIAQIRVRSKHVRSLLVRPRTSFVTEMLVSVQAL